MKANEFLTEHKKNRKAVKYNVKPEKPRNFVAKNAINTGAGAHKDKKKAAKQGDVKHKNKEFTEAMTTGNPEADQKIAALEAHLAHLQKLMPTVEKISKENHYVFEEIESEVGSISDAIEELGDAGFDLQDAVEEAIQSIRRANGSVFNLEQTLKQLIRQTNTEIEDIHDSEEWERRYGKGAE